MKLSPPVEDPIRAVLGEWERSWNAHDMHALANLFTDDADFVNVYGAHWCGRAEIALRHEERHATRFRASTWRTRAVAVSPLSPDIALVHVDWERCGDLDFDGKRKESMQGIFTWVLLRRAGRWLIRAAQNTNVLPVSGCDVRVRSALEGEEEHR
jgi:uncharacterized protein (TIGR02246 family)